MEEVAFFDQLKKDYELTKTECRVTALLLRGYTEVEIAEQFKRSYHTIHSHTKSIYKKTRVSSKMKLAALLKFSEY